MSKLIPDVPVGWREFRWHCHCIAAGIKSFTELETNILLKLIVAGDWMSKSVQEIYVWTISVGFFFRINIGLFTCNIGGEGISVWT